jgi:predicted N-formylglutamate amidohydrolase
MALGDDWAMVADKDRLTDELLGGDEPPAYELIEHRDPRRIVLVCDHASNRVPAALGTLGVTPANLERHIAWDIGAGAVTRLLSERLGANTVLGGYSRLAVDLNRDLEDPTAFPAISDGILVPSNLRLSVEARARRARALFKPYHEAVNRVASALSHDDVSPVFVAIHSFTPRLHGVWRPWHIGVLWDKDPRLAVPLLAALRQHDDLVVGDNEPYSGRHPADFTIDHHAEPRGLAHVGIEIRQDLIDDDDGQRRLAGLIGDALEAVLIAETLYEPLAARGDS